MPRNSVQSVERRRFPRISSRLGVAVAFARERPVRYLMLDFCEGGMLLGHSREAPRPAPSSSLAVGDRIQVVVPVVEQGTPCRLQKTARVVRLLETGFGVAFATPDPEFVERVRGFLAATEQPAGALAQAPQTAASVARFQAVLSRFGRKAFRRIFAEILRRSEGALLEAGDMAVSQLDRQQIMTGLTLLKTVRGDVDGQLVRPLFRSIRVWPPGEKPQPAAATANPAGLSLVDTEEFEVWLEAAKFVSRMEDSCGPELLAMERLVAMIGPAARDGRPVVPFSPQHIGEALEALSYRFDLGPRARGILFEQAAALLQKELALFYRRLMKTVRDLGLVAPSPPARVRLGSARGGAVRTSDGSAHGITAAASGGQPVAMPASPGALAGLSTEIAAAAPGSEVDAEQLLELLAELPRTSVPLRVAAEPAALVEHLSQAVQEQSSGAVLSSETRQRVELAAQVLDGIRREQVHPRETAAWYKDLQLPLLGAAVSDPGFLQRFDHPLRILVDRLDHLGTFVGGAQASPLRSRLAQSVEQALQPLRGAGGRDEAVQRQVAEQLTGLAEKQSRDYQRNVERVVAACAGRDRLRRCRLQVRSELAQRYGGRPMPRLFVELLDAGWRALLELSLLQRGSDSPEHENYWRLLDDLVQLLGGKPSGQQTSAPDPGLLLRGLEDGLSMASFDPIVRADLLERLRQVLIRDGRDRERLAPDSVFFEPVPVPAGAETGLAQAALESDPSASRQSLEQVQKLRVGDLIRFLDAQKKELLLRLAWISAEDSLLTLVDQRGLKEREMTFAELAQSLQSSRAEAITPDTGSLSERAADDLRRRMEERLSYRIAHDSLTGLYGRQSFQGLLADALAAKGQGTESVLCWLDLDEFKLVNNVCGHQAGDQLLIAVAGLLERQFGDRQLLGHLGGDHFAVLLRDCSEIEAQAQAESLCGLVARLPYYWEGRRQFVSASIGLVGLAQIEGDLGQLLQAADVALSEAKRLGGNRAYRLKVGDKSVSRYRESMEWLLRVNRVLESGQLRLRCQRIEPVDPGKGLSRHYEVLLGVLDPQGQSLPIGEFIAAAEEHKRMSEVDRWVTRTVFAWVAEHRELVEGLSGFAINLCGHTMNDESFGDFVTDLFHRTQIPAEKISFEVTETVAVGNLETASRIIGRVKALGCSFALDDFGTGMSSYSYLKELPVDWLKIDGAFVKGIATNRDDYAVVKSINEIGHFMGKRTIAEYVENDAILACLREIGVDYAQGFGVEKPRLLEDLFLSDVAGNGSLQGVAG